MNDHAKSDEKWTVMSQTRQSFESKWTVIRLKVDGPDESNNKSRRSGSLKVDGPKICKKESRRS